MYDEICKKVLHPDIQPYVQQQPKNRTETFYIQFNFSGNNPSSKILVLVLEEVKSETERKIQVF